MNNNFLIHYFRMAAACILFTGIGSAIFGEGYLAIWLLLAALLTGWMAWVERHRQSD